MQIVIENCLVSNVKFDKQCKLLTIFLVPSFYLVYRVRISFLSSKEIIDDGYVRAYGGNSCRKHRSRQKHSIIEIY